jgi:hypothetical protein
MVSTVESHGLHSSTYRHGVAARDLVNLRIARDAMLTLAFPYLRTMCSSLTIEKVSIVSPLMVLK